jgi:ubiquinone/menaquinone biosynthesis C-methylase UbiE
MSADTAAQPNAAQIEFWNGPVGRSWVNLQETWDIVLAPVLDAAIARADPRPGERVIDIGCGCGASTIALARRVAPDGKALGVDISQPMLARAAERRPPDLPIELVLADATTQAFARGAFDLLFSRFGVMFFADPVRAFANLRSALKPGGRLAFACFRSPRENPFMMMPLEAAYQHVPPLPKLGPEDPSPFAFASEERVRRILGEAGFDAIGLEPYDLALDLAAGGGLDAAVAATMEIGATNRAIAGQPPEIRTAVAASIRRALGPHARGSSVPLASAIWVVTAANSAGQSPP